MPLCIFDDDQRRDRPQPPSALRVAAVRADFFVAPPPLWQGMAFVVASRTRPVALATNVAVFRFQCTHCRPSTAHFLFLSLSEEGIEEDENDPTGDRRIRDVKSWPGEAILPVEFQKIHHIAVHEAVGKIPQDPS